MPKRVPNKKYSPEFKKLVVETMLKGKLDWERIYLEEGPEGLAIEHRGRGSTGRPKKLPKAVEEDLLTEVQRLRAENEYLKNLQALVLEDERRQRKKTLVVQKLRHKHSLEILLTIAQLPRATY